MQPVTLEYKGYIVTTDKSTMKLDDIHRWLTTEAYWSKQIPYETVKIAFENSFCIGVLHKDQQIGYARFVTDYASFAYLADVYVEETHRGIGLSKKMLEVLMNEYWVKKLRRIMLATIGAHGLYQQYGFTAPKFPDRLMEITRAGIYGDASNPCK
ncbi:MAG: GNAT family N-acetyltransferase [Bacteroidota bacterium]